MKKILGSLIIISQSLFPVLWAGEGVPATAMKNDLTESMTKARLEKETAAPQLEMTGAGPVLTLAGKTETKKGNKYLYGSIRFQTPQDWRGKRLIFNASSNHPDVTEALYIRCFNRGESHPSWGFFSWSKPLSDTPTRFVLTPYRDSELNWEANGLSSSDPNAIDRVQLWIGTSRNLADIDVRLSDFKLEDAPVDTWVLRPEYATAPAPVTHPAGLIKTTDINLGRDNVRNCPWAAKLLDTWREKSKPLMAIDPQRLATAIPAENPWLQCPCPRCGVHSDFAWSAGLRPDGESIACAKCGLVLPSPDYPEDRSYTVKLTNGRTAVIKYRWSDKEFYGEHKQYLSGLVNWAKVARLYKLPNLAYVYALTGEKAYAEQVRALLLRFAEVYPGYVVRFRCTAYESPRQNFMASKMADWKFQDSMLVIALATAYDLTAGSGLYSDADRLQIENGIFREYKWLISAYAPTRDWCSNAVPAHMTAGALTAVMLGDHALMRWVLEGDDGLKAFIENNYHADGFWNENSASYAEMSNQPLLQLLEAVNGYSDPAQYTGKDRYDNVDIFKLAPRSALIFGSNVRVLMPDGNLPATNDSCFGEKIHRSWLEFVCRHFPSPANRALLQSGVAESGYGEYSLFKLPGKAEAVDPSLLGSLFRSQLITGPGWAILRPDNGKNDTALLLAYSPFSGGHTHNSSLNFIYYDFNRELITDLGYLHYTHPLRPWLISPLAHNLVVVDGELQSDKRHPQLDFFSADTAVKVAAASSPDCYPGVTREYGRTMFMMPLANGHPYVADFFRVVGGKDHLYVLRADGAALQFSGTALRWQPESLVCGDGEKTGAKWFKDVKAATVEPGTITAEWPIGDLKLTLFWSNSRQQQLLTGTVPAARDPHKPFDVTTRNAVFMARAAGPENLFMGVLEAHRDGGLVKTVKALTVTSGVGAGLEIIHQDGTDILLVNYGKAPLRIREYPGVELDGAYGAIRIRNGKLQQLFLGKGRQLTYDGEKLSGSAAIAGGVEKTF